MLHRFVLFVVLAVTLALVYLAPQGLFTRPLEEERTAGPFLLAGVPVEGARERMLTRADSLAELLARAGQPVRAPALLLLANPETTPEDSLRGVAGAVLDSLAAPLPAGLDTVTLPARPGLVVDFPLRGSLSPPLAGWKVYRGLAERKRSTAQTLELLLRERETLRFVAPREPLLP